MLSAAWGGSPANEGPETGIKSLCHRFHHASSKQDQQDLVEDLTVRVRKIRTYRLLLHSPVLRCMQKNIQMS